MAGGLPGFVYVIKLDCSPPVYKIGGSRIPETRMKQFCGWMPWRVTLAHKIATDDTFGLEHMIHVRFAERYLQHEWFALTDAELALLRSIDRCETPQHLPEGLRATGQRFARHHPKGPRKPKPLKYDPEKYLNPNRDPWKDAVTKDTGAMVAIGQRARTIRHQKAMAVAEACRPFAGTGEKFLSTSWIEGAEDGEKILTASRLWAWAWNLGVTLRELLGPEHSHLVEPDSALDKPRPDDKEIARRQRLSRRREQRRFARKVAR